LRSQLDREIVTGLGGPHASADPEIITRFPYFDFTITGEAEITLPKIIAKFLKDKEKPAGVYPGEAPLDLDELPSPAYHLVDWSLYQKAYRTNPIMASRGCPFHCIFCSIPAIERRTRYRRPQRVVAEMKLLKGLTGCSHFTFLDDTLTLNRKFFWEVCEEIINQRLGITFEGHTRANLLDEELVRKMKQAGLTELIFGVESGSERIRNQVIGKGIKDKDVFKAVRLCKKYKIKADLYLMLGFPTETREEIEKTVNFPWRVRPFVFGLHITLPLPGAPLWDQAIAQGKIPADTIDRYARGELGEGFYNAWPYYVPDGLTLQDLKEAQARAYRKYYLYNPRFLLKKIGEDLRSPRMFKNDLKRALSILFKGNVQQV